MVKTIPFNGLSIEELSRFLLGKGFTVGSNKPSEYVSRGLMLQGMRNIDNGGSKSFKIYYNPLVLIEYMTASLLKKGNWLELDPCQTYTKFTDLDVLVGRVGFYNDMLKYENRKLNTYFFDKANTVTNLQLRHFYTDISYWYHNTKQAALFYMDAEHLSRVQRALALWLCKRYRYEEAANSYMQWAKWQYFLTFKHVFDMISNEIFSLPLTPVKTKQVEEVSTVFNKEKSTSRFKKIFQIKESYDN